MKSEARFGVPTRALALVLGMMLVSVTILFSATGAEAKPKSGTGSLPVTGTLPDGGTFTGAVSNLDASANKAGDLVVSGVLTGTATDAAGNVTQITQDFTTTAAAQPGNACDILFLDLGPIFLDVLGLQVDLSQIVLDINAVPGAGNLLGNLLCAITGLLDNPGNTTNAIANLLDWVLGLLG